MNTNEHFPLKVLSVMNSFKESISSAQANEAVNAGLKESGISFEFDSAVFADGGQGTLSALEAGHNVDTISCYVYDALMNKKEAVYTVDPVSKTVYMEMAQAAPLTAETRNHPLEATTFGVGQMIVHALDQGYRHFVIGIGGSATTDGGKGMLEALGFQFVNSKGEPVSAGNSGLNQIRTIEDIGVHPALKESIFEIACDVVNPLLGPQGCVAVFGPQKGVGPDMQEQAEQSMQNWNEQSVKWHHQKYPQKDSRQLAFFPGAGAAGGLGYAFLTYLNGTLKSGADLILEKNDILKKIQWADYVITGEGAFDFQSLDGKGPGRIIEMAKIHHKKVLVFAGSVNLKPQTMINSGVDGCFSIMQNPCSLQTALDPVLASQNLKQTAAEVFILINSLLNHC